MKKLMVMLGVVALAAGLQAAVVNWGTSSAVTFNGKKLAGKEVQLWMVGVAGSADVQVDLRSTMTGAPANQGKLNQSAGTMQTIKYTDTVAGGPVWDSELGDLGREYYIVLTYNDGTTDYTYTSSAVASSGLTDKSLGALSFTFNDKIIESGTDGWVAQTVPEPTSGLLLLLGVAGLALKRRRA